MAASTMSKDLCSVACTVGVEAILLSYGMKYSTTLRSWGINMNVDLVSAVAFAAIGSLVGQGAYKHFIAIEMQEPIAWAANILLGGIAGGFGADAFKLRAIDLPGAIAVSAASTLLGRGFYVLGKLLEKKIAG